MQTTHTGCVALFIAAAGCAPPSSRSPAPTTTPQPATAIVAPSAAHKPVAPAPSLSVASLEKRSLAGTSQSPKAPTTTPRPGIEEQLVPSVQVGEDFEPYLSQRLSFSSAVHPYFLSEPGLQQAHGMALALASTTAQALRSGRWRPEARVDCPAQSDGHLIVGARSLVLDENGLVRAFAEDSGTDDSAGVERMYFDESSRLRLVAISRASIQGFEWHGLLVFNEQGELTYCASAPDGQPLWFCDDHRGPEDNQLDPEVADILRPEIKNRPPGPARPASFVYRLLHIDPRRSWAECSREYLLRP